MHMNKGSYEKLIAKNIEWLMKQERCLEREHIKCVLENSAYYIYDEIADLKAENEKLDNSFLRYMSEIAELRVENAKLKAQVEELEGQAENREYYIKGLLP